MLLRLFHSHAELGSADALPLDRFERNGRAHLQRMDRRRDRIAVRARVGQRADRHIAADARERIEIAGESHALNCSGLQQILSVTQNPWRTHSCVPRRDSSRRLCRKGIKSAVPPVGTATFTTLHEAHCNRGSPRCLTSAASASPKSAG